MLRRACRKTWALVSMEVPDSRLSVASPRWFEDSPVCATTNAPRGRGAAFDMELANAEYRPDHPRFKQDLGGSHGWSEMRQKGLVFPTTVTSDGRGPDVQAGLDAARRGRTMIAERAGSRRPARPPRPLSPEVVHDVCGKPRRAGPGSTPGPRVAPDGNDGAAGRCGRSPGSPRGGMPDAPGPARPAREPGLGSVAASVRCRGLRRMARGREVGRGSEHPAWMRPQRGGSRAVSSAVSRRVRRARSSRRS